MSHLSIAVVGHSNAGKTSIVSALTRDADLEIAEGPGTTLHRYEKVFSLAGEAVLGFIDTPGFETASRINEWLDGSAAPQGIEAPDGRTLLERFLAEGDEDEFRSEKEALRGALEADVLAYIADAATEPKGQQRQEVRLLRRAGIPVVAVINAPAGPYLDAWESMLNREGVDMLVRLDAWDFPASQEERFYKVLAAVRPEHEARFDQVRQLRADQRIRWRGKSARVVASALVDILAFRVEEHRGSRKEGERHKSAGETRFERVLSEAESAMFEAIQQVYDLQGVDVGGDDLDVEFTGAWKGNLFDAEVARRYGASMTTLAIVGGLLGSPLDHVGGFGLGTAIGALAGATSGYWLGGQVSARVDRNGRLTVGPVDPVNAPTILVNRAVACWREVEGRSHARRDRIELQAEDDAEQRLGARGIARLGRLALRVRKHPDWSLLAEGGRRSPERDDAIDSLAALVEELLVPREPATD